MEQMVRISSSGFGFSRRPTVLSLHLSIHRSWTTPARTSSRPMLFAVLALTVVAAAAAATGPAHPDLEMDGSVSAKGLPPAALNSTLSLVGRALTITAGADYCTGTSAHLPIAECSAWLDLYDKTGGTDSGVRNATFGVIEQCALSCLTD